MKRLLLAGTALTFLGGSAMAADLAVRRPAPVYVPPPVVAYFTWTGCYVGGNVGGVWIKKDTSFVAPAFPGSPVIGTSLGSHDTSSWLGGVQGGCDYQVGGWVFGIQGDYDWMDASGSHVDPFFAFTTHSYTAKSLASVTGRVGYAWDRFLGYVKGGGAWERDEYTFVNAAGFPGLFIGPFTATASETRGGWTLGIGGEYAFTNWLSAFVEYDYYNFGTRTNAFACAGCFGGLSAANFDIKETKNVVKVGLNVRFGPLFR